MAKVKFKRINTASQIDNVPIEDGSFIVTGDGKSYIDYGLNRIPTNGTLDTEMSDGSLNGVENKVIKEYVDNTKEETIDEIKTYYSPIVLWENQNPTVAFSPANITLSSGDYDFLEIYFYDWADGSQTASKRLLCQKTLKGYSTLLSCVFRFDGTSKSYSGSRAIDFINNTTLAIGNCYSAFDQSAFRDSLTNYWCVPVKILGYK